MGKSGRIERGALTTEDIRYSSGVCIWVWNVGLTRNTLAYNGQKEEKTSVGEKSKPNKKACKRLRQVHRFSISASPKCRRDALQCVPWKRTATWPLGIDGFYRGCRLDNRHEFIARPPRNSTRPIPWKRLGGPASIDRPLSGRQQKFASPVTSILYRGSHDRAHQLVPFREKPLCTWYACRANRAIGSQSPPKTPPLHVAELSPIKTKASSIKSLWLAREIELSHYPPALRKNFYRISLTDRLISLYK